jgi:hypothetical protein
MARSSRGLRRGQIGDFVLDRFQAELRGGTSSWDQERGTSEENEQREALVLCESSRKWRRQWLSEVKKMATSGRLAAPRGSQRTEGK